MRCIFAFVIYGVGDPWAQDAVAPVLYTTETLPTTGLPAELTGCTQRAIVTGRPGMNQGADPRNPVGGGEAAPVTILDDEDGTLGTLFFADPDAALWGLEDDVIDDAATTINVVGTPAPTTGLYYLGNEAVNVTNVLSFGASGDVTHQLTMQRARCGSLARTHVLSPADPDSKEDEGGTSDRLWLTQRPSWEEGFYCGVYLFTLDQFGAIESTILRRGVVKEEPTPAPWPTWSISIQWLEDHLSDHKIGGQVKEVTLTTRIVVAQLEGNLPKQAAISLNAAQAKDFFNTSLTLRGNDNIVSAKLADLNTRIKADPANTWEVEATVGGQTFVFKLTNLSLFQGSVGAGGNAGVVKTIKLSLTLQEQGYAAGATIRQGNGSTYLNPWWTTPSPAATGWGTIPGSTGSFKAGTTEGEPPKIKLRLRMKKSVVKAFLTLACSRDGSSGDTYDKLIGSIGAGMPQSFFSLGAAVANTVSALAGIPGNTSAMLQMDQLLNPQNTYYFDLTKPVSLKDFLTNEFIASQLLLGSLQSGLLALKSWVHEVASTVTLNPKTDAPRPATRLPGVMRLDLAAGTRVVTLEPLFTRSVRFQGVNKVTKEETQAIRFWREGLNLSLLSLLVGDVAQLIRIFYKMLGGRPFVHPVASTIEDHIANGLEFGDSVSYTSADAITPSGRGISGEFFIVGIDLNYDEGVCTYLLIKNNLFTAQAPSSVGNIAPSFDVIRVIRDTSTAWTVEVRPLDSSSTVWDPSSDYSGVFAAIEANGGKVKLENYSQAPVGDKERPGSLEVVATLIRIFTGPGGEIFFDLEVEADFLRGGITDGAELTQIGETRILLPDRQPAASNLSGALVEADAAAGAAGGNFVSFQSQRNPLTSVTYTTRH